jgi:predicted 3-demethylubiquinone-9 3-methyltransferase (glyoxalase superfamily)
MKTTTTILLLAFLAFSCADNKSTEQAEEISRLQSQLDSLKTAATNKDEGQIATFLTFQKNDAEEAMNFYISLFDNSEVISVKRWGKDTPGKEGTIMHATFRLDGRLYMCSDSPPIHDWDFTPGVSNYVQCKDEPQLDALFAKLSESGEVMMPPNNYGFSKKFAFVADRFGVSWQLNLD